ncbi:MAG: hypothetical protein ACXWYS_00300, partial [Gaiellaceae bacterium]
MSRAAVQAPVQAAPFPLRPAPEQAGTCPRCDLPLAVDRLRFPGWRSLLDGTCAGCGHRYLQDLPAGHGLVYPSTLDLTTGETFDPSGATWFSSWLRGAWEEPDGGPVELESAVRAHHDSVVLLNCLDPIYGHALLKLLNVQRELASEPGCIVLVPAALTALVPDGVAEAWIVREPVSRLRGWLVDL